MEADKLDLAPLLARRELWRLVSVAFADPYQRERMEILRDPALRERTIKAAVLLAPEQAVAELGPGEEDPRSLALTDFFAAFDIDQPTLEVTHRQLFGLTAISPRCPPCEIEYEPNPDICYRAQRLADIGGFYRAFGLQVSSRAAERLDHVTIEAEFLYVLLAKEAAALDAGNHEGAVVCREARRKFFQEHLGWWLPAFAHLVSRLAPAGYYRQLTRLTAALCAAERVSLGLPVFRARIVPKPSGSASEAGCYECLGGEAGLAGTR